MQPDVESPGAIPNAAAAGNVADPVPRPTRTLNLFLSPYVNLGYRGLQLIFCICALAVTASMKMSFYLTATGFYSYSSTYSISFADTASITFLLVASCLAFVYVFAQLVVAALRAGNLLRGLYGRSVVWWGQVIADLVFAQLLFAATCAAAGLAVDFYANNSEFTSAYVSLVDAAVAMAFFASLSLFVPAFLVARVLYEKPFY